jgi:hypothetical protein
MYTRRQDVFLVGVKNRLMPRELAASVLPGFKVQQYLEASG